VSIWKIAHITVVKIPELYGHFGYSALGEVLSGLLPDVEFLGARLWQWVGLITIMVLAYFVALLLTGLIAFFLRRKHTDLSTQVARFVAGPIRFLLWILLIKAAFDLISPTVTMQAIMHTETLSIIVLTWTVLRLSDFFVKYQEKRLRQNGKTATIVLLRPVRNIWKTLVFLAALLIWLDNIGFKVTTLIAGLGVGGIAVALAAQRTIEDLIGSVILLTSQPVSVGDFCKYGDTLGTVEEIGIRSTRIRTLDNTIVTVPNGEFSKLHLENFALREKIWYHPRISLRYETTPDQIRTIISDVEKLLHSHPKVLTDSARIRFTEIGGYALGLDIFAYVGLTDYSKYLKVAEELNFEIMEIVERAGTRLALPAQTMYLEGGKEFQGHPAEKQGEG
jgi:MscS family membrane protein